MENRFFLMIVAMILVILFASGFLVSDQQVDVAGCTAKWRTTPVTVRQSELCSQAECEAQPAEQQHNAIVDALLCACGKAKTANYGDEATNNRIEEVVNLALSYQASAQEVCEQPGLILVKSTYG